MEDRAARARATVPLLTLEAGGADEVLLPVASLGVTKEVELILPQDWRRVSLTVEVAPYGAQLLGVRVKNLKPGEVGDPMDLKGWANAIASCVDREYVVDEAKLNHLLNAMAAAK